MQDSLGNHWLRQGAKIRSTANDIKRNAEALADELGEELLTIQEIFAGTAGEEVFERVIDKMAKVYPISRLDLDIKRDDTDDGVVVQTPERALASARIFTRADKSGQPTPYYEYRDAAMSSVGPYRPEWIKELRTVQGDNPSDFDVAYNSGHLMHQNTFFVGPVNFYWKIGDTAYMERMDTGDSNYITPFVPHSFASRDSSREAYIVAVTFSGNLDSIQQELMTLDPEGVARELLDLSDGSIAFSGILRREMANAMLGIDHLSAQTGIDVPRLQAFLDGSEFPVMDEMQVTAQALGTSVRDLLPPRVSDPKEVVVKHGSADSQRQFPSNELPRYTVEDLAGSSKVPFLNGMSLRVQEASPALDDGSLDLATPSHEFCYNYGTSPVQLYWRGVHGIRDTVVEPGGSYYLKPTVRHALRAASQSQTPAVVVIRIGGSLYGDGHLELSSYPKESLHRVLMETQQWYDPSKIGG